MEHEVRIAGLRVLVPIHVNQETTEKLAQEITERVEGIEKEGSPINTQRFALKAAYLYAMEVAETKAAYHRDVQELTKALERLNSSLKDLVDTFHLEPRSGDE